MFGGIALGGMFCIGAIAAIEKEIADKVAASLMADLELDMARMEAARKDECRGTNFAYTTFPPRYVVLDCTCGQCNK